MLSVAKPFLFFPLTAEALLMNLHNSFNRNPCLLASKTPLRRSCAQNSTMFIHRFAGSDAHAQHILCMQGEAAADDVSCVEDTRVQFRHRFYSK